MSVVWVREDPVFGNAAQFLCVLPAIKICSPRECSDTVGTGYGQRRLQHDMRLAGAQ
jgi:hypothetical protein